MRRTPLKLIVQIPCLNEEQTLAATLAAIPREIPGIDSIELLVIDDGSTDGTVQVAAAGGVEHILSNKSNQGLARSFSAGLQHALRLGADIVVNTDGDNQYCGADLPALVQPILEGRADIVIGDRQTGKTAIALDTIINQRDKGVLCVYCAIGQRSSSVARAVRRIAARFHSFFRLLTSHFPGTSGIVVASMATISSNDHKAAHQLVINCLKFCPSCVPGPTTTSKVTATMITYVPICISLVKCSRTSINKIKS